eukprot:g19159.t1
MTLCKLTRPDTGFFGGTGLAQSSSTKEQGRIISDRRETVYYHLSLEMSQISVRVTCPVQPAQSSSDSATRHSPNHII